MGIKWRKKVSLSQDWMKKHLSVSNTPSFMILEFSALALIESKRKTHKGAVQCHFHIRTHSHQGAIPLKSSTLMFAASSLASKMIIFIFTTTLNFLVSFSIYRSPVLNVATLLVVLDINCGLSHYQLYCFLHCQIIFSVCCGPKCLSAALLLCSLVYCTNSSFYVIV